MDMSAISITTMSGTAPDWDAGYAALMLFMWWVMMMAMMLPSAAPMILLFTALNHKSAEGEATAVPAFVLAYIVAWCGFSILATTAQWALMRAHLLSPMMQTTSALAGGILLVAAGVWQLTPFKHACLRHCRSPVHFFARRWCAGTGGAFRMGFEHGMFCLGCCWGLMALLFYGGVMNLRWITGLATYVLIEKVIPGGHWLGRGAGILLVVWGAVVIWSVA